MSNEYRNEWLHDENNSITVLPYTTLDNIKINDNGNFSSFKEDYLTLQNDVNLNTSAITTLNNNIKNLRKILYGTDNPSTGNNGDIYLQHDNNEIIKICQKVNGEWYSFKQGGQLQPAVNIGNVDIGKKPKININVTICNQETAEV